VTGPLGWLTTRLGDAAAGVLRRQLSGRRWVHAGAIRRYRRRVAAQAQTVPIPFDVPFDLPLPEAYLQVTGDDHLDPATVVVHRRGTLVLGPPGAGKSTFLRYLLWSSSSRGARGTAAEGLGRRLAVEVPLSRVDQLDDVAEALVEAFERHGLTSARDLVRRELAGPISTLTVLFDGLDEVGVDRRAAVARLVSGFVTQNPSVKFVVTCRTQAYHGALDGVVDQTIHLQPLGDELVAQLLRAWPSLTASATTEWLVGAVQSAPWLASLARNPLVLAKLAVLFSTTYRGSVGDLLHDRRRVCREVADLLLARWKPEHNRERDTVKKAVLQHLAADGPGPDADPRGMRYEEVLAEVRVVLTRHDHEPAAAAAVLDEIVERSGLLERVDGGERYRFSQGTLQQWFAAVELHDRPTEVLHRYRTDRDAWRGVLELSCEGDRDATEVIDGLLQAGETAEALACLTDAVQVDGALGNRVVKLAEQALLDASSSDDVVGSWAWFVSSPKPPGRAGFDFLASQAGGSARAAAALARSRLPQAAEVLARWATRDEKVFPHLERMGPVAIPSLAGLAANGSIAAAQTLDRIVNAGRSSPVVSGGPVSPLGQSSASPRPSDPVVPPSTSPGPSGPAGLSSTSPGPSGPVGHSSASPGPSGMAGLPPASSASPGPSGIPGVSSSSPWPSGLPGRQGPRRWRDRRGVVAVAVATVCVLVVALVVAVTRSGGDGDGGGGSASPDDGAQTDGAMELVWSTPEIHVASQPVLAGGNVVAHVVDGDGLALVGYDPASGTEVWRLPSTASQVPTGVVLSVISDGDRVFHMSPQPGDAAVIEAVDAATGDPLWRTGEAPGGFGDPVDFCGDDDLCVSALVDGIYQRWTIDVASGEVAGDVAGFASGTRGLRGTQPIEGRSLGFGLVDVHPSRDIALVVDGDVIWQRSPSELFGGHEVSPDYGWSWRTSGDLLVGTLGTAVDVPEFGTADVVPQFTAGIDVATGETVWVAEGDPNCGDRLDSLNLQVNGAEPWLRCRMTGTLDWEDSIVTGAEVDVVMEGFDPTTGESTWTAEMPGASGLYVDERPLVRFGRGSFALTLDDGDRFSFDLTTGRTVDVDPDTLGWCYTDNTYRQAEGPDTSRLGPDFTTPCDLTGQPHRTPAEPDDAVGLQLDGTFVWMDPAGLHGARLSG
jgi:NACHT domain-containing protein/putative pyrroloquinoline-quinone binding quinoprotein